MHWLCGLDEGRSANARAERSTEVVVYVLDDRERRSVALRVGRYIFGNVAEMPSDHGSEAAYKYQGPFMMTSIL